MCLLQEDPGRLHFLPPSAISHSKIRIRSKPQFSLALAAPYMLPTLFYPGTLSSSCKVTHLSCAHAIGVSVNLSCSGLSIPLPPVQ